MDLVNILKNIGLPEKEAKVYLSLLEIKEATPSMLARKTGVNRSTTYLVLEQLQKNGLVSHYKRNKLQYYRALHPNLLLEDQYNKYLRLKAVIPKLINLHGKYANMPNMTIYEGMEGLIAVMEDTLTTSTELLCWADIGLAVNTSLRDYYPTYSSKKIQRKLPLKGIYTYDQTALRFKKYGDKELRDIHIVPKDRFPFKNEINIYDDKVAIISHQDEIGVIIQNKYIADTQRAIFQMGFEYAALLEKELLTEEDLKYLNS